jgi:hypothetical protein
LEVQYSVFFQCYSTICDVLQPIFDTRCLFFFRVEFILKYLVATNFKIVAFYLGLCAILLRLYGASKKTLHQPWANFRNMLFQINYSLNYYLQLLCLQLLLGTHLHLKKIHFWHQNSTSSKIFIISVCVW